MKLLVFSHKECWLSSKSPTGWATDGGFAMHMDYLSTLFDSIEVMVPMIKRKDKGEVFFNSKNLDINPLILFFTKGLVNKIFMPFWVLYYLPKFVNKINNCDAIHAPIPSNIGTIGFILAHIFNKPLYIRHCGNWFVQKTVAEVFWKWYMEKFAGGKKLFVATGGANMRPSLKNENIKWIFSSSITMPEIQKTKVIDNNYNKICIVCRQEKGKGTELLLHALKLLKEQKSFFYLDVVGDGGYITFLKSLSIELGINDQVHFYGKLNHEEVLGVMKKNLFFVYPTESEGFPKVVLEAMSQGLIVLTTSVSVLGKMITDSKSGMILNERSAQEITTCLNKIMIDKEKILVMSQNAIQYSKQYTLDNWAKQIGKYLEDSWQLKLKTTDL